MSGKLSFGFAAIGVLWCAALVVYLPTTFLPGDDAMIPVVIPVVLAVGVFLALQRSCHGHRGRTVAWALAGLLYLYSILTGLSIGVFILPAAVALLLAAAIVPTPR